MKKKLLKVLTAIGYYGSCCGLGYALGKIASWLINKIGANEEMAMDHPWKYLFIVMAVVFLVIVIPTIPIVAVLSVGKGIVNGKIDKMSDGYIPAKEESEWD